MNRDIVKNPTFCGAKNSKNSVYLVIWSRVFPTPRLGGCPGWPESLLGAHAIYFLTLVIYLLTTDRQTVSYYTQQITHKSLSISILTHRKRRKSGCTCHFVGFVVRWLILRIRLPLQDTCLRFRITNQASFTRHVLALSLTTWMNLIFVEFIAMFKSGESLTNWIKPKRIYI